MKGLIKVTVLSIFALAGVMFVGINCYNVDQQETKLFTLEDRLDKAKAEEQDYNTQYSIAVSENFELTNCNNELKALLEEAKKELAKYE